MITTRNAILEEAAKACETGKMRALSIRSPWWWFILHGGKDIENRDWSTRFRGPVLIHASKWFAREPVYDDFQGMRSLLPQNRPDVCLADLRAAGGHIVGVANIVDCISHSKSDWFFGPYGFELTDPIALLKPIPCKGALKFFAPGSGESHACAEAIRALKTEGGDE